VININLTSREKTMNFIDLIKKFPDEKSVIDHFITIRYPEGIKCNHCGSTKVYQKRKYPKVFNCNGCDSTFSIFKDTIFEKTSTDLRKWVYAIHLFLNSKKGISGYQLQREIKVTYKCAWRMLHQIRKAMGNKEQDQFARTVIEMDETYIGGKPRKDNNNDDNNTPNKRGRGTKKHPVVGIADRINNKIHAKVAQLNKKGKKLSGIQLLDILDKVCKDECNVVITDEFSGYNRFSKTKHVHLRIDHSKEYTNGFIHTNNIESFWAVLKRGIYGIYHHVSIEYLQNYINEFCFRFNNRKNGNMFDMVLKQAVL
jgi:transposase-like protein